MVCGQVAASAKWQQRAASFGAELLRLETGAGGDCLFNSVAEGLAGVNPPPSPSSPSQTKPDQTKPDQARLPSQAKPSQAKPSQASVQAKQDKARPSKAKP